MKQSQADGDADIAARRARVLRHEDLCAKLRQPPLGFEKAEQWNGFVPPKYIPNQHGNMVLNNSARRAALVDIDLIAISREQASE